MFFKVWRANRKNKAYVMIDEKSVKNLVQALIQEASIKLKIQGHVLVLEVDGTPVDYDEVLMYVHDKVLLLLLKSEEWVSASDQASAAQVLSVSADEPHQRVEQEPYTEIPSVDASAQSNHVNLVTANVVTHYEINWQDFQVPWHMLPSSIIANFESGKKESVAQLIHTVIDVARGVSKKISAPAMKIISKKIVDKYPQAFEDRDDDGRTIGDGTHTIFQKLKGRYFYLNDDDGNGGPSPAKKSKKSKNPPEDDEPTLDESNQGEQAVQDSTDQKQLNEYTLKKADEEFYRLLQLCYKRISSYLNQKNTPSLDAVQRNWPVIFKSETIKWFFREQTELDVNLFGEKLSEKAEKILTALYNKKCGFVPVVTKNQPGGLNALERVSVHLKEDFSHFFKSTAFTDENPQESSETTTKQTAGARGRKVQNCYPHVREIKTSSGQYEFKIMFGNDEVGTRTNAIEAVEDTFALYFIFNLKYPTKVAGTLEFVQMYFFKMNTGYGTSVRAKAVKSMITKIVGK